MIKHWTIFEGGPNRAGRDALRVTLSPKKTFLLNRKAYEALGSPAAVELRFDEGTRTIGLKPTDTRRPNAFPVKQKAKDKAGKYNYRLIYASPFCKHFDIRPEATVLFNKVDLTDDGIMLLELSRAVKVGRGSR